ncbi:hypothetical protein FRC18_007617 [Serendipita sp. 400]|nr:hypothetical protein FRC18_007617 [Serendipita sp. 400]
MLQVPPSQFKVRTHPIRIPHPRPPQTDVTTTDWAIARESPPYTPSTTSFLSLYHRQTSFLSHCIWTSQPLRLQMMLHPGSSKRTNPRERSADRAAPEERQRPQLLTDSQSQLDTLDSTLL